MVIEEQSNGKSFFQSKIFRGLSLVAVTAILTSGATYLAVKGGASEDTSIVTMKGDTITVSDFYQASKNSSAAQQSMLTLVLTRVFEEKYGNKVSNDEVTKAYNETADSYGGSFSSALSAAGLTTDAYKQQIRTTKLIEYAVDQAAKKELTDENYKAAYDAYNADTKVQVIQVADEETAKSVLAEATADGADFASIAKDKTTAADKTFEYTINSSSTDLPNEVMQAAFNQEAGKVSEVINVLDATTYAYTYYIVKTVEKSEKDSDLETYKDQLKEIILTQYKNDTSFQDQVIAKALEEANVKIKDDAFASILSQYATTNSAEQADTAESSTTEAN